MLALSGCVCKSAAASGCAQTGRPKQPPASSALQVPGVRSARKRRIEVGIRNAVATLKAAQDVGLRTQIPELEDVPLAQRPALFVGQIEGREIAVRIGCEELTVGGEVQLRHGLVHPVPAHPRRSRLVSLMTSCTKCIIGTAPG